MKAEDRIKNAALNKEAQDVWEKLDAQKAELPPTPPLLTEQEYRIIVPDLIARKLPVVFWVPKPRPQAKSKKRRQYEKQKGICLGCDEFMPDLNLATWDHIVPVVHGGSDKAENKILMCAPCNSAKSSCRTFKEAAERAGDAAAKVNSVQQAAFRLLGIMKRLRDKGIIAD